MNKTEAEYVEHLEKIIKRITAENTALEQQQHPCGGECKCKAATVVWCKDCRWYHDEVCCNDDSDYCADYPDEYGSCKYCEPKED